jgi:hypothetical protein
VWRDLRDELHGIGFEVVSVAMDSGGAEVVGPFIEKAAPTHPSVIDRKQITTELFGFVNAPSSVWIDEQGVLVRPPETVYALQPGPDPVAPPDATPEIVARVQGQLRRRDESRRYTAALRDWATKGARSRFALTPDVIRRRTRSRPIEHSRAAAEFTLALELHERGSVDAAASHFKAAQELHPESWTYKRQAYSLAGEDRERLYQTDLQREMRRDGAPPLYLPLEL